MGQVCFLKIRLNPDTVAGNQTHYRAAEGAIANNLLAHFRCIADHPGEGRTHNGPLYIQSGAFQIRHRLLVGGVILNLDINRSPQRGQYLLRLLLNDLILLARHGQIMTYRIKLTRRDCLAGNQRLLPIIFTFGIVNIGTSQR